MWSADIARRAAGTNTAPRQPNQLADQPATTNVTATAS
jgi:hypothetical protein